MAEALEAEVDAELMEEKIQSRHRSLLIEQLQHQRDSGLFCDVQLVIDDRDFKAHRCVLAACSAYFDSMFRGGFREVDSNRVELQCTSADGMHGILDFMYAGTADLTLDNVYDVIRGADHFMMENLKDFCGNFLGKHLTASNCFDVRDLAKLYDMKKLEDSANRTIEVRISEIMKDPMSILLQLPFEEIMSIVSNEKIQVKEEDVLAFIISWTKHDPKNREVDFAELLSQIRLDSIDGEILAGYDAEELIVRNNTLFQGALNCDAASPGTDSDEATAGFRLQPRLGRLVDVFILCGGSNWAITLPRSFHGYIINENRWVEFPPPPMMDVWPTQVIEMDNKLYTIGSCDPFTARGYNPIQTSAAMYDALVNTWHPIANPIFLHYAGTSVVCNSQIYCIGGKFCPRKMEMYDPKTNSWTEKASLPSTYEKKFAAVDVNDRYIYIIEARDTQLANCQGIDFYDTHTDQWQTSFPSSAVWEVEDDDSCQIWPPVVQRLPGAIEITRLGKYKIVISTESGDIILEETVYPRKPDDSNTVGCPAVVRKAKGDVFVCSGNKTGKIQSSSVDLRPNDGSNCMFQYANKSWKKFASDPAPTMIPGQLAALIQIPHNYVAYL